TGCSQRYAEGFAVTSETNRSGSDIMPPFLSLFSASSPSELQWPREERQQVVANGSNCPARCQACPQTQNQGRTCPGWCAPAAGHDVQHVAPTVPAPRAADDTEPLVVFDPISGFEDNRDVPDDPDRACWPGEYRIESH